MDVTDGVAVDDSDDGAVECGIGAQDGRVVLRVGPTVLQLTPDQAEQLATDLRSFSIEVRNGGRVS